MDTFLIIWMLISFTFGFILELEYVDKRFFTKLKIKHIVVAISFLPMTLVMLIGWILITGLVWISYTKVFVKISKIMNKDIKRKAK